MPPSLYPSQYRGRFAPSPSGHLHFGSLVTALASYLDARVHSGSWVIRIEDIDPPREEAGAAEAIIRCLAAHGMESDEPTLFQSQRLSHYEDIIQTLLNRDLAYFCQCSRKRLSELSGIYDGQCRNRGDVDGSAAVRLKLYDIPGLHLPESVTYQDRIQGPVTQNLRIEAGDQVIKRRDGLYGYTLAVIVDDITQGITHIVRGADLLEVTPRHLGIYQLLNDSTILPNTPPSYAHTPLAIDKAGYKLSKQNRAQAINNSTPSANLVAALQFLNQSPPLDLLTVPPTAILEWAVSRFNLANIGAAPRQQPVEQKI